jgi:hypothetical protein
VDQHNFFSGPVQLGQVRCHGLQVDALAAAYLYDYHACVFSPQLNSIMAKSGCNPFILSHGGLFLASYRSFLSVFNQLLRK